MNDQGNCPFYGRHLVWISRPFALLDQKGNQCAVVIDRYAPCMMEVEQHETPDWKTCPRLADGVFISLDSPANRDDD